MKTPVKSTPKISEELDSDEDFINDEPLPEEDEDGPLFYYKQDNEEDTVSSVQVGSSPLLFYLHWKIKYYNHFQRKHL